MANQNLFLHIAVFVGFVYIVFIVAVQFSWNSIGDLLDLKYFRDGRFNVVPSQTAPTFFNMTNTFFHETNSFLHETSDFVQGVDISPPSSVFSAPPPFKKLTDGGEKMGGGELQTKNDSKLYITRASEKNRSNLLGSNTKGRPHINCSKSLLLWCNKTNLGKEGTFFCKKCQCYMKVTRSVDIADMKNADIVLFYHMIVKPWQKLVRARPKGQLWVFFSRESPMNCVKCMPPRSLGPLFNISLTYHSQSDIVVPYGSFIHFKNSERNAGTSSKPSNVINWAKDKTKSVLWVASNCVMAAWGRPQFVRHLSKYSAVDVYGRCGNLSCPIEQGEYCEKKFSTYKFYLALENTPCREYITEKVWRNSFERKLVPIVFGADRSDYENLLPPNSFIFAEDFNSTRELAEFLNTVDRNDTLYNEFFKWREEGSIKRYTRTLTFRTDNLCRIISKASCYKKLKRPGVSVEQWWRSSCRSVISMKFTDLQKDVNFSLSWRQQY